MSQSQQWVGPQKAVNAEDQRLRGRQAIALTSVLVEKEVLRQACLQRGFEETVVGGQLLRI